MYIRAVELREDIKLFLATKEMEFVEKIIDMMVDEFGERIDSYEAKNSRILRRETKTYEKLLVQAVRDVCKRIKNIDFAEAKHSTIEDDYSEESNAEYKFVL